MNFKLNLLVGFRLGRKLVGLLLVCTSSFLAQAQAITSPNKNLSLQFELSANGVPSYQLSYKGKSVIKPSTLGIEIKDAPSFMDGFSINLSSINKKAVID